MDMIDMILAPGKLARLPKDEWEIQVEVWHNNGEISLKQAKSLNKMIEQWNKTGCPITFPRLPWEVDQ